MVSGTVTESAPAGWRENPIEPDPNPKRRLLVKFDRGQAAAVKEKRDQHQTEMQVEDTSEKQGRHNITRDTVSEHSRKSEPVAVTTQEAIEGDPKKARSRKLEQIELGNIMELSITGQVLKWARQVNLSGGVSLRKADGWNLKNHSHLTVARHLREKIHPSSVVVTIRENEEEGICSAALRELWRIIQDQIEERSVL